MHFTVGSHTCDGIRPAVMGILNITPDSFYEGSRFPDCERAVERALEMVGEGADIIDVGGESSRPGAEQITIEEELERVIPIIKRLAPQISIPVSIDTYHAEVAARALDAGAVMVNDISALRFDPDIADVVAASGASVVLMHMQGNPQTMQTDPHYDDVVGEILDFLKERVSHAVSKGIQRERILVDPGIGFGKKLEHNCAILRHVGRFHETGCAVLVGASRKRMIQAVTGAPVGERIWGTAAIVAHCVCSGVEVHRVHDVGAMRQVCDVAAAVRG
ncbi:dihydropteroate synthase [bacterium]|nr:dihydropteroate synthase [bacterium]